MAIHPAKIVTVAKDRHRHKAITPRPPGDLSERALNAVIDMGTTLNAVIIGFLRWYVGESDELPPRPQLARAPKPPSEQPPRH